MARGGAAFHAVRGEYGSGETFFARRLAERAKRAGLATAEIQVSETETPLHRWETVYRRLTERLSTATHQPSALRPVIDSWLYTLDEALDAGDVPADDADACGARKMSVGRGIVAFMSYYVDGVGWRGGPVGPADEGDELDEYSSWDDDRDARVPLSLVPAQQAALAAAVETGLRERGCDNTLRSAQEWAAREGVGWAGLQAQLEGCGGYCDCEVLLNVLPADEPEPD